MAYALKRCNYREDCPTRKVIEKLKSKYIRSQRETPYFRQLEKAAALFGANYCASPNTTPGGFQDCPTYQFLKKREDKN